MNAKEKAYQLVNRIYQPLGHLLCGVSATEMWNFAKARAIENVNEIINACDEIYDSDKVHFKETLNGEAWMNVIKEIRML